MFTPTQAQLNARHWFPRKPLTDRINVAHYKFPVIDTPDGLRCLCRRCTPADDMRKEEMIQTAFVKAMEVELDAIKFVRATRGFELREVR
jgi:hypothetical protein